ncbi:MAG: phytanoyl-CoA dioxygenase family protein, partial [Pseudomonadota bacterium]
MHLPQLLQLPLSAAAVVSAEKSFRRNPVIGSRRLNARGLHRGRVVAAARLSAWRRARLAGRLDPDERAQFDRDGFVIRQNALPPALFDAVQHELATVPRDAWELRQGHAANRVMPLPPKADGTAMAALRDWVASQSVRELVGYAAGRTGHILTSLQTIEVNPLGGEDDPQAMLHADTFHPNAKFWLFLHDVGADEGPFSYVPGSHILTDARLEWEHAQALNAAQEGNVHHAAGSFRLAESGLGALGYGGLQSFPVKANTLVVADTFGFHKRTPSQKPTVRTALYGILRRNPFTPWNGLDLYDLPVLR